MIRFPTAKKPSTPIGPTLRARGGMDARIRLALELMHQQCGRTLTVGEVAGRFRLSESRFEHLFKLGRGRALKWSCAISAFDWRRPSSNPGL